MALVESETSKSELRLILDGGDGRRAKRQLPRSARPSQARNCKSCTKMAVESATFWKRSPLTYFQTVTHQISFLASLDTLSNFIPSKTKNNLSLPFKPVSTILHFSHRLGSNRLKLLLRAE